VRLTPRGRFIDYRWSVVLLALAAIGCSDGSTAPNHVRDLAIAGQLSIRSRAYAMDWIDIRVDGRVDSVGWSSTGDDVFGSASLTAVLADDPVFKADAARIGAGVHELSAIVQPFDWYYRSTRGFPLPAPSEYYSVDPSYVTVVDRMTREVLGTKRLEARAMVTNERGTLKWTLTVDSNGVVR
jgi:hypothetical protein